jgi:hypothetical protein
MIGSLTVTFLHQHLAKSQGGRERHTFANQLTLIAPFRDGRASGAMGGLSL